MKKILLTSILATMLLIQATPAHARSPFWDGFFDGWKYILDCVSTIAEHI